MSVKSFVAEINRQLETGSVAIETALPLVENDALAQSLSEAFSTAADPIHFETQRINQPDSVFNEAYEVIASVLDASVLEPKDVVAESITDNSGASKNTSIVMARGWKTLGDCQYDASGKLLLFDYAPDRPVFHVASAIIGSYMSLSFGAPDRIGLGIGGVGQMATRLAMQRGKGLGSTLHADFERTCAEAAANAGEKLTCMFLEAEEEAIPFWRKMGYRYVTGSRYFQPPIAYDPTSGAPLFDAVPESAMVKQIDRPNATSINAKLLCDIVKTIYTVWYGIDHLLAEHQPNAQRYLESLYQDFVLSIQDHGENVPVS